jgi:hypothetical protein
MIFFSQITFIFSEIAPLDHHMYSFKLRQILTVSHYFSLEMLNKNNPKTLYCRSNW